MKNNFTRTTCTPKTSMHFIREKLIGVIPVKAANVCGGSAVVTKRISLIDDAEKVGARITNNKKIVEAAGVPDFVVFPNPATSSVTIIDKVSTSKGFTARLTDGNGRVVRSSTSRVKIDWSVGDLAPGVYYIVINDGRKVIANKKLLVSH